MIFYVPFIISLFKLNPETGFNPNWHYLNYCLILFGIALSFSTLQDTKKTQNTLSRKVWESARKGKFFLWLILIMSVVMISLGVYMLIFNKLGVLEDISIGIIVMGISFIGILKAGMEMFENHRKDKNEIL